MMNQHFTKAVVGAILFVALTIFVSCAVNPVTGQREFMLLTEQDERQLGAETDQQIAQMYGMYENAALTAYVNGIGVKLKSHTHRPAMNYSFKVLDSPIVNAFAVPGGYIYVTRGILAHFNNEAELAGVLALELGHVNARHTARAYSRSMIATLGIGIGAAISEGFARYAEYLQFGVTMLFLKFSRDDERQADDLGVEYSSKGGYDARQMANFFETLERMSPGSGGILPDWFSTHPNPRDRVQAIQLKAAEWRQKLNLGNLTVRRNGYLYQLDGLVYGEDPRQGYVEGNTFYHPNMRFMFPVPSGWNLVNTPSQVQMVSSAQDAVILLTLAEAGTPRQAAEAFYGRTQAVIQDDRALTVGGFSAHKVVADFIEEGQAGTAQKDGIRVMSVFIKKDNTVYVFHGYSEIVNFANYQSTFRQTMENFQRLTNPARINVKPERLATRKVSRRSRLRTVFRGFGTPDNRLEEMAILNGMHLDDWVDPNTIVKVVRF